MSLKAHIPSHRKPRRSSAPIRALRTGVAGGALATMVATAAPASAAEAEAPVEATAEIPVVDASAELPALSRSVEARVQEGVDALEQTAFLTAVQAEAEDARTAALKAAEKTRKAEEAAEARAAAAKRAAQERASRTAARTADLGGTAATGSTATLISFLKAQLGKAYVMGGTGPSAYDCSGLTQTAFRQIGVSLPRTAAEQSTSGTAIPVSDVRAGDLVFWGGVGSAYHVAVYIGDGKYLDAANPSKGVVIQEMSYYMPTSAVRVL